MGASMKWFAEDFDALPLHVKVLYTTATAIAIASIALLVLA